MVHALLHIGRSDSRWFGRILCCALGMMIMVCGPSMGQVDPDPGQLETEEEDQGFKVDAAKMDYDRPSGVVTARGNVVIRRGKATLRADYVKFNSKTEVAHAVGNVVLSREGQSEWHGKELTYNFRTKEGDAVGLVGGSEPFFMQAEGSRKTAMDTFVFENADVSTCSNDCSEWHYHVRASEMTLIPGESISGRGAKVYLGKVPIMYLPYWWRDLDDEYGWTFEPGYSSRMGAFLLSGYSYPMGDAWEGETHLHYRIERGVAVGQDLKWEDPVADAYRGMLAVYYAHDSEPIDEDEDPETADIDTSRYRVRIHDHHAIGDRDYIMLQAHYLSDTDILEDFFEDEYREQRQPDNYLTYTHRADWFTVNALARGRLNDFYNEVNRLPEVSVDITRTQIAGSDFYYEGQTAAAYLERVRETEDTSHEDYSSVRFDTSHRVYYPGKYFGFLSFVPRTGYRGTYYTDTRETVTTFESVTSMVTNFVVVAPGRTNAVVTSSTTTNEVSHDIEQGADLRNLIEFGFEVSFKAFKTWEGGVISPMRHIVEPYLNYTIVPEPELVPANIYQFDSVDTLGEQHWTKVGFRNKIQTKHEGQPFDLLDVDLYTIVDMDTEADEEAIENVYMDAELRPSPYTSIDLDAIMNVDEGELSRFNAQFWFRRVKYWQAFLEYRFRNDVSSLFTADMTYFPNDRWSFNVFGRHEFEDGGRLEEIGAAVQRNWDCMVFKTGLGLLPGYDRSDGTEVEDEWRVLAEFWLTAFPKMAEGRHRK